MRSFGVRQRLVQLRRGFGVASLALLVLVVSCEEQKRQPIFSRGDARVELGFSGAHHEDRWNTLFVELKNRGATFDGTIDIVGRIAGIGRGGSGESDPVTYRTRIEVPQGEVRRLRVPVRAQGWDGVTIRYRQDGYFERHRFDLPMSARIMIRALAPRTAINSHSIKVSVILSGCFPDRSNIPLIQQYILHLSC